MFPIIPFDKYNFRTHLTTDWNITSHHNSNSTQSPNFGSSHWESAVRVVPRAPGSVWYPDFGLWWPCPGCCGKRRTCSVSKTRPRSKKTWTNCWWFCFDMFWLLKFKGRHWHSIFQSNHFIPPSCTQQYLCLVRFWSCRLLRTNKASTNLDGKRFWPPLGTGARQLPTTFPKVPY